MSLSGRKGSLGNQKASARSGSSLTMASKSPLARSASSGPSVGSTLLSGANGGEAVGAGASPASAGEPGAPALTLAEGAGAGGGGAGATGALADTGGASCRGGGDVLPQPSRRPQSPAAAARRRA